MEICDYETNTLVVSNIASIAFRVYRPVQNAATSIYTFSSADVEKALRNDGHLVFADSRRQGIWCFRLLRKDGSAIGSPPKSVLGTFIDVGLYKLRCVDEGSYDVIALLRGRPMVPNAVNTPNSSSSSSMAPSSQSHGLPSSSQGTTASAASDHEVHNATVTAMTAAPEPRPFPRVPTKVVYNFFISAILASLSATYCLRAHAVALNSRTFLLPPLDPLWDGDERSRSDRNALVSTLRVGLTTGGFLLVGVSHSILQGIGCSEWACFAGLPPTGVSVLAAPWGKFGTVRGVYPPPLLPGTGGQSAVVRPKKMQQTLAAVPQVWKGIAAKMLEARGTSTSVLQNSMWLIIEFVLNEDAPSSKTISILWPSVLCFWSLESSVNTAPPYQKLDPLAEMREAYLEEIRGEEAASKAKDADVLMKDTQGSLGTKTGPITQTFLGVGKATGATAATNFGTAAAAAAAATAGAGTIYPTPPDGVPNPVGATPTFDGSTSSPGNLAMMAVTADADVAMADTRDGDGSLDDFWGGDETKHEGQGQSFMVDPVNMFGGLGNDMFGENITDADFNFFDEKPDSDVPVPAPVSGSAGPTSIEGMHLGVEPLVDLESKDIDLLSIPEPSPAEGTKDEAAPEVAEEKPASPVFAKPELKHARSNLGDLGRELGNSNGQTADAAAESGIKRPPSPFDAVTVFKRIRAEAEGKAAASGQSRKRFEGLKFTDFMIENSKKYERNGKFGFHWPYPEADMLSDVASATSPTAFRRPVKKPAGPADPSPEWGALISSITRGMKSSSLRPQQSLADDGGDTSSGSSEAGSSSGDSNDDDELLVASTSQRQLEASALADALPAPDGAAELSRAYGEGVWDFPISRYFADPMPPPEELAYADDDVIEVAQILTQQLSRATIRLACDEDEGQNLQKQKLRRTILQRIRSSVATLQGALPAALDEANRCALKPYLEVKDVPLIVQPSRLQSRLPPGSEQLWSNLYGISTPHVELRRHDWTLSVVPPAVELWEVLGLEPLNGAKEIKAVCMYPDYGGLATDVNAFLSRMRIVYESLRLGTHERLSPKANIKDGLVAFDASQPAAATPSGGPATPRPEFTGADQVHKLAQALASEDAPGKSLVVYFVYCSEVTGAIVDACLAFQRLSQLYEMAVTSRNTEPKDLVLQLIPSSFVASPTSLAVPSPTDLLRLCLEVYDRCASVRGPKPSPAFLLEQPPPRMLDLKLSASPSVDVQRENSFIHVAYALSADGRWVTAAWTDATGWRQFSAAYWVGRKGRQPENSFSKVAAQIWNNTRAIVANLKVHWRAVIAKCSPMEPEEVDVWTEVTKGEKRAAISVTLVTVGTQPTLELLPPVTTVSPAVLSHLPVATPASTPQTSVFSPEHNVNPATPAGSTGLTNPATPAGAATPATPGGAPGGPLTNSPVVTNTPGGVGGGGGAGGGNAANASSATNNNNNNNNNPALAALSAAASDPNAVSEIDGNVVLVDIADSAWGAVPSHRLNTASTWVDLRPALVSGYLIKRGGIQRDDAPVVLEVNVIRAGFATAADSKNNNTNNNGGGGGNSGNSGNNSSGNPVLTPTSPRAYEVLVREILSAYRGLGTLARTRGILDSERDVRPWHVAAAERSAKALCRWM